MSHRAEAQMGEPPAGVQSSEAAQESQRTHIIGQTAFDIKKREATLRALCALEGVTLIPTFNDRGFRVYIVSRWALTKELPDLDAVEVWLKHVRGSAA